MEYIGATLAAFYMVKWRENLTPGCLAQYVTLGRKMSERKAILQEIFSLLLLSQEGRSVGSGAPYLSQ